MIVETKQLLGIASLFLCFIGASSFAPTKISPVAAASSSFPLNAYHFGAGAVRKEAPVAKRSYKGYVPDGLTIEEYTKIKEEELKKQRSMNFGMWGPRFKQIDGDPDSNWFNLPSLWTTGFNSNPNLMSSVSGNNGEEISSVFARMAVKIRRFLLPYLMLVLSIHLFEVSITAKNVVQPILRRNLILSKFMLLRILVPLMALKPLDLFGSKVLGWKDDKNGMTKLTLAVGLLLCTVSFVLKRLM